MGLRAASLSLLVSVTTTDREYKLKDGPDIITCWPGFLVADIDDFDLMLPPRPVGVLE